MTTDPSTPGPAGESDGQSGAIAKLAEHVDRIARQTNMLLLEAALDAAKAAECGERGLAVTAREVKQLAERTRLAAQRIDLHRDTRIANDTA
jgi:methyl-accepting chemotaxis protein